ncbi:unnamed protein product, partial [Owenia fusiformis]
MTFQAVQGRLLNIMTGMKIPCDGYLMGWMYELYAQQDPPWVCVFRSITATNFELVHRTQLPTQDSGVNLKRLEIPFKVAKDDIVGLMFSSTTTDGSILQHMENNPTNIPTEDFYETYLEWGAPYHHIENTEIGDNFELSAAKWIVYKRVYQLQAV